RVGPRLLDGDLRQGRTGRAGRRRATDPAQPLGRGRGEAQVSESCSNDEVVDRALASLKSAGVRTAEVFLRDAQSGSVDTKDGAIESVMARGERGLGVRVLDDQRMGFAHSSDL